MRRRPVGTHGRASVVSKVTVSVVLTGTDAQIVRPYKGLYASPEERKNSSEVSFLSSELLFRPSVEDFRFLPGDSPFPP